MIVPLAVIGIAFLGAAAVGGGLEALGVKVPVLASGRRQLLLAFVGAVALGLSFLPSIPKSSTQSSSPPQPNPTVTSGLSQGSSPAPPATVNRAFYIGHIVEWVNGGGQPNASWLVGSNGERYWIPNRSIFSCLVKEGHTDRGPQPSTVLDDLPDLGKWASCPATVNRAAYVGHIVEWVNGGGQPNASWLVGSNGERYWIPNTSIFSCLVKEGHTDRGPQPSTVLDDLPDLGKWASCA